LARECGIEGIDTVKGVTINQNLSVEGDSTDTTGVEGKTKKGESLLKRKEEGGGGQKRKQWRDDPLGQKGQCF